MRTLNVRLAAILLAVIVVFGFGVYWLHAYQVRRNAYVFQDAADRDEERAKEAIKQGNARLASQAYGDVIKDLGWYVRLVPTDVDAVERLGILLADHARDVRMFSQGFGYLERTVRQDPDRDRARRKLVDMAMKMRRYPDAKEHLKGFLLKQTPKDAELWDLLGQCEAESGNYESAEQCYHKAIELSPDWVKANPKLADVLVTAYPHLADVLRNHLSRAKEADAWMDKLVKANPQSPRAHFLRGIYLKGIDKNSEALEEALAALKLKPDAEDALWLASQCYLAKDQFAKARDCATHSIKLNPRNAVMYVTMADIELRAGSREKAIAALEKGLAATERSPQLLWSMANLLIDANQLAPAGQIVEELQAADYSKQLTDYLVSRIDFARGRWLAARTGFEKVRAALAMWPNLLKQVDVWIGQCYGQLGNRDRQVEAYRRALNIDPFYAPARAGLTDSLMAAGNLDEAIQEYRQLALSGKMGAGGLIPLARMLILQNLRQSRSERNWAPVERLLDQVDKASPDAVRIPVLRAEILVAQDRIADAEAMLMEARDKNPKQAELWLVLAALAEHQQNWDKAQGILDGARKRLGDSVSLRLAEAQLHVRRDGNKSAEYLRKLADDTGKFTDAERLQLWNGLVPAASQIEDRKLTAQLCQKIVAKEPQNIQIRYVIFEQALRAEDDAAMAQVLKDIEAVTGRGAYWHYGQAVLLSVQAKKEKNNSELLKNALDSLSQARELRPSWARIPLVTAVIYDQQGKNDAALKEYLEAIEMGEHGLTVVRRAVELLFQRQRYADADRLLRDLEKQQVFFSSELTRASAEAALQQGEFGRALEMARKAAMSNSKSYREQVWLGQVLGILGRRANAVGQTKQAKQLIADAESALRRAVEIEPTVAETWVALIQFLSAIGEERQAEKAIDGASKKIPAKKADLAIAQCYEAMKKTKAAEERYGQALAAAPDDPFIVRSVADFYCRTNSRARAEELLRKIIDGKVKSQNADVVWARRQLAVMFASRGGYQNIQKARDLIEDNLATAEASVLDRRVMAGLDAADPKRSRRDDAIRALEAINQEGSGTPDDRFELAQMYRSTGAWVKASALFRNLVASYPKEPRYLATYITALLEHGETSSAETYLERLEKTYPNHIVTVGLRAESLVARNEPDKAYELLKGFIDKSDALPPERNVRVRLVAEKCEQLSRQLAKKSRKDAAERFSHQAEMLNRAYVDQNTGREWELVAFLARQGRIDEALELLDRTWEGSNAPVVAQVCSDILHSNKIGAEQLERLNRILEMALRKFERPIPLLMVMAELYGRQTRYSDAEGCYRDILAKNSSNATAMNNLAVLLALQGIKLDDAIKLINRAIEIAGPGGAMLDSRASVHMAKGEPEKAIEDLADALADAETPVRLFHQAQAYQQIGRSSAAATTMESALKKGLTKEMLHPLEIAAFEKLSKSVQ